MTGTTTSGAELKVQLTGLGLTPAWFAQHLQVTPRTVVRWFNLDAIPRYAAAELEQIRTVTAETMKAMLGELNPIGCQPEPIVLYTHRTDDVQAQGVQELNTLPAAWHRALTFRVLNHLRNAGGRVTVAYMPRQAS